MIEWFEPFGVVKSVVISSSKKILELIKKNIQKTGIREDHFFVGNPLLQKIEKIPFEKKVHTSLEEIWLLFFAFKDRFNVFKPLEGFYTQQRLQKQQARQSVTKEDKRYFKLFNLFHGQYISNFYLKGCPDKAVDSSFFKIILDSSSDYWILGEVGCGKSTFISHLLSEVKTKIERGDYRQVVFCIDFSYKNLEPYIKEGVNNRQIIFNILNTTIRNQFRITEVIQDTPSLVRFIKKNFKLNKVTFIIDNLDRVYDESNFLILKSENDLDDFNKIYEKKSYSHIAIELLEFMLELHPLKETDVRFIIGLRQETFSALDSMYKNKAGRQIANTFPAYETIHLINCPSQEVINNRFSLGAIEKNIITEEYKIFFYAFSQRALGLKIDGFRHVMTSLSRLNNLGEKPFYPDWMIDIFIYLDGFQSYEQGAEHSEHDCGVINIFLVNISYRIAIDEYHEIWTKKSKTNHFQTYWLKYFVSHYYYKNSNDELTLTKLHQEIFHNYERQIFNFVLHSLSEAKHGRLITCNYQRSVVGTDTYILKKTNRLDFCFKKNLFFSFSYLAVVVDDPYLEKPKVKNKENQDELEKLFKQPYIYNSIFIEDDHWKIWLEQSIKKVFTFVKILEISFSEYENDKINLSQLNMDTPKFDDIFASLEKEISIIGKDINFNNEDLQRVVVDAKKFNKKIDKGLRQSFKKYKKFVKKKRKHS